MSMFFVALWLSLLFIGASYHSCKIAELEESYRRLEEEVKKVDDTASYHSCKIAELEESYRRLEEEVKKVDDTIRIIQERGWY